MKNNFITMKKAFIIILILTCIISCSGGSSQDTTDPAADSSDSSAVLEFTSLEDSTDVGVSDTFKYTFTEAIDTSTATTSTFFILANPAEPTAATGEYDATMCDVTQALSATVSCSSSTECTLDPSDDLAYETTYAICLTPDIAYDARALFGGASARFKTETGASGSSSEESKGIYVLIRGDLECNWSSSGVTVAHTGAYLATLYFDIDGTLWCYSSSIVLEHMLVTGDSFKYESNQNMGEIYCPANIKQDATIYDKSTGTVTLEFSDDLTDYCANNRAGRLAGYCTIGSAGETYSDLTSSEWAETFYLSGPLLASGPSYRITTSDASMTSTNYGLQFGTEECSFVVRTLRENWDPYDSSQDPSGSEYNCNTFEQYQEYSATSGSNMCVGQMKVCSPSVTCSNSPATIPTEETAYYGHECDE